MILADTSVWADHIRRGNDELAFALARGSVVIHDFILGELLLGHIKHGSEIEQLLFDLERSPVLPSEQVVEFIRAHRLAGAGIGWTDAHLLASAARSGSKLWTLDKRLGVLSRKLDVAWPV